jgi:hypothetical protein
VRGHGESVLARPHLGGRWAAGVVSHAQVIEDQADIACEALDGRGDGVAGLRPDGADGEAAKRGDVLGAVTGAQGAAILVPVPVEDVVAAVLDGPVAAVEGQYGGGVGALRGVAGDAVDGFG